MTFARVPPGEDFKRCCMLDGTYDGVSRSYFCRE
jgi:hypothetical protein